MPEKTPLIIAHRGSSAIAPENTAAAFRQAINDGASGVEFDVQLTKDNVAVVFHDPTLQRICNQKHRISNLTAEYLKTCDAGSWFNEKFPARGGADFSQETIWNLEKTLKIFDSQQSDFLIYVELKCTPKSVFPLVEAVAEVISESKLLPQIIIKSFDLEAISEIKKLLPKIKTAALFAPKMKTIFYKRNRLIDEAVKHQADELSIHFSMATKKIVEDAKEKGMETIIWTADHPVWIKRAKEIGLKAIITNDPARLISEQNKK